MAAAQMAAALDKHEREVLAKDREQAALAAKVPSAGGTGDAPRTRRAPW